MRTQALAAPLTVWVGTTMYTFAPGRDVTVGRDIRSDVCLDGPDSTWVSREHLVLRFDGAHWVVIDRSRNGTYLDGVRVSRATIRSGQHITAGDPHRGPRLIFQPGVPTGAAIPGARTGPAALTAPSRPPDPVPNTPNPPPTQAPTLPGFPAVRLHPPSGPPDEPTPFEPASPGEPSSPEPASLSEPAPEPPPPGEPAPADSSPAAEPATVGLEPTAELPERGAATGESAEPDDSRPGESAAGAAASAGPKPPEPKPPEPKPREPEPLKPGQTLVKRVIAAAQQLVGHRRRALRIGRSASSDIAVHDPLVSRVHAVLRPTDAGWEIRDRSSRSGTYLNADPVSRALLRDGDIVTVGNADFAFTDTTLVHRSASAGGGVEADRLGLVVDGHQLVTDVSFTARPGTLTAVIGPPGAGKSSLIALLSGAARPTSGWVTCDGQDLHTGYASLRSRIAVVPHDDVMHDQLSVEQIVAYAAELRLPGTVAAERRAAVNRVIEEVELGRHRATRAGMLSAGDRKRVSVAIELLTGPSLVLFQEPPGKPDRWLDRQVMTTARRVADAGRVVVVAIQSLTALSRCDQVLLLASGAIAFAGAPGDIEQAVSKARWSQAFPPGGADTAGDAASTEAGGPGGLEAKLTQAPAGSPDRRRGTAGWRQTFMLIRRQVRLIAADRGYLIVMAALPLLLGALSLLVPHGDNRGEAVQILVVLNGGAVVMGVASTIRGLVAERAIFRREHSFGLSVPGYVTAKIIVFGLVATLQTAALTAIVAAGKHQLISAARGTVLPDHPIVELYLALAATAVVSAVVGLALSALAEYRREVPTLFLLAALVALVFAGGIFPLGDRVGLNQISWLVPARWGFAASACTVDLAAVDPAAAADLLWTHSPVWWTSSIGILLALGALWTGVLSWRLRSLSRS